MIFDLVLHINSSVSIHVAVFSFLVRVKLRVHVTSVVLLSWPSQKKHQEAVRRRMGGRADPYRVQITERETAACVFVLLRVSIAELCVCLCECVCLSGPSSVSLSARAKTQCHSACFGEMWKRVGVRFLVVQWSCG